MTKKLLRATRPAIILFAVLTATPTAPLLRADHVHEDAKEISELSGTLSGLNNALLRLISEGSGTTAFGREQLAAQAAAVMGAREKALSRLIELSSSSALGLALPPSLLARAAETFPESAPQLEQWGTWSGVAEVLIETNFALQSQQDVVSLRSGAGNFGVFVSGMALAGLVSGDMVTVSGLLSGDNIAAVDGEVSAALTPAASCFDVTGDQKIAVLMVTFPGVSFPSNVTRLGLEDTFFGNTAPSVNTYWQEVSHGQTSATAASGDVFPLSGGPYVLKSQKYGCNVSAGDYITILDAALEAAAADSNFNAAAYDRIFMIHPSPGGACWSGLGSVGCWGPRTNNPDYSSYSWQLAGLMSNISSGTQISVHEGGHNMTLRHATSRDFGAEALGAPGTSGTFSEYGDRYSNMGSGNIGHYNAQQKVKLGWLGMNSGSRFVQKVESSGAYSIAPFEDSSTGVKALKVRRGSGTDNNWLWIEYRNNSGDFDTTTTAAAGNAGALIHYEDFTSRSRDKTGLLDFTPETSSWTDPALASGETWADTYTDLIITVGAATSTSLEVTVAYGTPICSPAAPSASMAPASQSVEAGFGAAYTVTVTNGDSSACPTAVFDLISAGWAASQSMTLNPGETGTADMVFTPPATTAANSYSISVTATQTNSLLSSAAGATLVVTEPQPCSAADPSISVSPSSRSVEAGQSTSYTATVTNNDSSQCTSAAFQLNATSNWASAQSFTLSPGETATRTITFTPPEEAVPNTYPIPINAIQTASSLWASTTVTLEVLAPPPPCETATPTVSLSPSSQSVVAGGTAGYTAAVTNNDSASCDATAFQLTTAMPPGLSAAVSQAITLAPGQSGTAPVDVSTSMNTAPADYTVTVTAAHSTAGLSADAGAILHVTAAPLTLSVSVSGRGQVVITPSSTTCSKSCTEQFESGTIVGFTALPNKNQILTAWGGACQGTPTTQPCAFTITSDSAVTAEFGPSKGGGKKK